MLTADLWNMSHRRRRSPRADGKSRPSRLRRVPAYYVGASVLGSLAGWFWHEGGWGLLIAFSGAAALIVLAVVCPLGRRGAHSTRGDAPV